MRGDWAGDFGQTQFLAVGLLQVRGRFRWRRPGATRAQRAGCARLTANYLKGYGWKAGQRWNEATNFDAIKGWNKHGLRQDHRRLRRASRRRRRPRRTTAALIVAKLCFYFPATSIAGPECRRFFLGRCDGRQRRGLWRLEHRLQIPAPAGNSPVGEPGGNAGPIAISARPQIYVL